MATAARATATAMPSAEASASSASSGKAGLGCCSMSMASALWHPLKAMKPRPWSRDADKAANNSGKPRASAGAHRVRAIVAAMSRRIAIVEDEPAIRANYAEALRKHGFEVAAYAGRAEALAAMKTRLPDLALIDIGLGADVDGGFALCRELRALSAALPIIFLTARDSDFDAVAGLRLGADDYLTKDVSLPHLLARIAALFRRAEAQGTESQSEDVLERGPLRLDTKRVTASWRGQRVDLTLTEFWIVHARHPGHVKS